MSDVSLHIRRAVVTGPTGAVGTSLINELIANGIEVFAVSRSNSARLSAIPLDDHVHIVECSLADYEKLADTIGPVECDAFFHLAWDGTYGDARQDWNLQAANIIHTVEAVKAAKRLCCKVFVGAGSQSEFGHVDGILHPNMACRPDNGYGAAKLAAGEMSRALCLHMGIRHEWCRIISMYGPGDGRHTLISQAIHSMLDGKRFACTPGDQLWDYIYNKDAARAFRLVAECGSDGSIYCIGSGKSQLLRTYIESIRDAIDPSLPIGFGEREYYPNQVMHLESDIENLYKDTGFKPLYSFEKGIRETIEWEKARH